MTQSSPHPRPLRPLDWRERLAITWALLVEVYFLSGIPLSSPAPDERFALGRLILLLATTLFGATTLRLHPPAALSAFLGAMLVALWLLLDIIRTVQVLAAQLLGSAIVVAAGIALTLVISLAACSYAGYRRSRRPR